MRITFTIQTIKIMKLQTQFSNATKQSNYERLLSELNSIRSKQLKPAQFKGNVQAWLAYGKEISAKKNNILTQIQSL
jgi:hypothetical protein